MYMFRTLRADEIDCRIGMQKEKFLTLLLYKDARCDMNILDETVGPMNWKRSHGRDNANCIVSIWDAEKGEWVSKEDTGTESNTEAEKGKASDSFKRACVNWGIGRELYTAPEIKLWNSSYSVANNGKTYDKFAVTKIDYDERRNITTLEITNLSSGRVVFSLGTQQRQAQPSVGVPQQVQNAMDVTYRNIKLGSFRDDKLASLIECADPSVTPQHKQAAQIILSFRKGK